MKTALWGRKDWRGPAGDVRGAGEVGRGISLPGWGVHGEFKVEVAALAQFGEEVLTLTGCENLGGRIVDNQEGDGQCHVVHFDEQIAELLS